MERYFKLRSLKATIDLIPLKHSHEGTLERMIYKHFAHPKSLLESLNGLREREILLDIKLIVEGTTFRAHKVVLVACSEYFRAMFTDNMVESRQSEIYLNGIKARGFKTILEYAYTADLSIDLSNIQDVLDAASYLQMEQCIEACSHYLENIIDLDNCIDILVLAETYSLKLLTHTAYRYISRHMLQFSKTTEFYRLTPEQLENILAFDFTVDCTEADLLRIVLNWFFHVDNHELKVRMSYAIKILKQIHFSEIPKRKLNRILDKVLENRRHEYRYVYRLILNCLDKNWTIPEKAIYADFNLINSRGMELAILKIGGFKLSGITNEITYCFEKDKKWKHLTSIPHVEQCNYGTAVLNNELYIVGGCFNQLLQENIHPFGFKYCPRLDTWTTMSPMKIDRCRFSLNVIGELLYAVGGASEEEDYVTSTCECYNPKLDVWYMIRNLPGCVSQHAGASFENLFGQRLYISGGIDKDSTCLTSLYYYDVSLETWETCAQMLTPRADHAMFVIGKFLYVCGGWTEDEETGTRAPVSTIDAYDTEGDYWTRITKIPTPRYHASIVRANNCIYFIGGFQNDAMFDKATAAIEYFDIDRNKWATDDNYPQEIWEHASAALFIPKCRNDMDVITTSESSI